MSELWFNGYLARQMGRTADTLAAEAAAKKNARYLAVLEEHLGKETWMLGDDFSLVDCCYGPVLDALALAGDYIEAYPALKEYLRNIRGRRSWRACEFRS